MYRKLSLEREVNQMVNDMMQKEGWTRSHALSVLRSKFESEERHQEVAYVDDLILREAEEQEKEEKLTPIASTTNTVAEEEITTNESEVTSTKEPSKVTRPPQQKQDKVSSKSISKQLDKQQVSQIQRVASIGKKKNKKR